jgi:exosome complex component MTR3
MQTNLLGPANFLVQSVVGKEIWLDPTEEETRLSRGTLVLASMPALRKITSVWQTGEMKLAEVLRVSP